MLLLTTLSPKGSENFWHLLTLYGPTTFWLCLSVGAIAWLMGVIPAYLVSLFDFPGKRFFTLALVLPLAIPVYLLTFIYGELLDYSGPVQQFWRDFWGYTRRSEYAFWDIRSFGGLALLMGAGLSPYVYLFTMASLNRQARRVFETARVLGLSNVRSFFAIVLPISRPAWSAGVILVMMETIAEFGAVEYFGVNTLTLGIFQYWLERNDVVSAARLAMFAGMIMLVLGYLEHQSRADKGYHQALAPKTGRGLRPDHLLNGYLMGIVCSIPLMIGFVIPVLVIAYYSLINFEQFFDPVFLAAGFNSFILGMIAAVLGVGLSVAFSLGIVGTRRTKPFLSLFFISYMLPGTIFALGVMLVLSQLGAGLRTLGLIEYTLIGSVLGLIYGYLGRFLALGHGLMRNGVEAIPSSLNEAGKLYGLDSWGFLIRIKIPLLSPFIVGAGLLIFVETIKELPMTLIMRPVGFESLATYLYQYASDENLFLAAPGALCIALIGVIPLFLLMRISRNRR